MIFEWSPVHPHPWALCRDPPYLMIHAESLIVPRHLLSAISGLQLPFTGYGKSQRRYCDPSSAQHRPQRRVGTDSSPLFERDKTAVPSEHWWQAACAPLCPLGWGRRWVDEWKWKLDATFDRKGMSANKKTPSAVREIMAEGPWVWCTRITKKIYNSED